MCVLLHYPWKIVHISCTIQSCKINLTRREINWRNLQLINLSFGDIQENFPRSHISWKLYSTTLTPPNFKTKPFLFFRNLITNWTSFSLVSVNKKTNNNNYKIHSGKQVFFICFETTDQKFIKCLTTLYLINTINVITLCNTWRKCTILRTVSLF